MAMTSLNISLPEPLKRYVEARVAEGEYGTPSEYVRDLIRHDRDHARAELERKLLEAMESEDISKFRGRIAQRWIGRSAAKKLAEIPQR